ncbi:MULTISPECIES: bifunctional DNA-formamidopyrimidine glycosylase/DNA-(apurinic or apyrimidinic site) lyase [Burkholderia]|uniref:bifunctional DNA-formamidopyrimidine glycosylase/DNA-(apurinic or apyrimidinic site) lyase n=1 Tax=Burkholderia TaxID=32008 RepID=UPI000327F4BF|nr:MULTISPECIES: bifunctional DNA-formamidopyrimidine glycosylase/DNA-(apurinic or apyrimidinic site) lyase [Burkholderia]AGK47098.1 formamidopyrimidine-DNA glycosylase [Burkholderia thailandensis MSMB121]ATF34906.1 bifunctional DNA-formamidopyrimidine glycosylase/DNA-(apurinic or apyrimidinic site) lyase [Burkholderia thailandensis]KST75484.1 formamidopyrimidine-DNA glycosylase [Burkholderia humptydooensis]KVN08738.1 formamidopyrimidine-DNA glycosylase [Burkholderia sp. MSMB1552]KWZ54786.1 fo
MPELPEVEVTRRGIEPFVAGRRVQRVDVRTAMLRWPVPAGFAELLRSREVLRVERRGKYLLFEVDAGWFIVHLGMTGTLRVLPNDAPPPAPAKHDHVDWIFDEFVLRFRDPRRFGAVLWHPRDAGDVHAHPLLASLGVEPFSAAFSGALLFKRTRGRTVSVKQALLAGDIVVGVGNIYASESLFRAGIRPTTAAGRVSLPRYERLADAVRATLAAAIERGGSTLRDFVGSNGESGYFQLDCFVYDRAGEPCRVCGAAIRQIVQGQRSTYFCPNCQR